MTTAATSKYTSASSTTRSAATDQSQAASVPIEMSVSIVAVPCRAFSERGAMEAGAGPEDDRRRQCEREPLPAVELQRRDHREQRERRRESDGRDDEPAADRVVAVDRPRRASAAGAARYPAASTARERGRRR